MYGRDTDMVAYLCSSRLVMTSKAEDSWTEPEGVLCRLYKSGLVKFGVNLS